MKLSKYFITLLLLSFICVALNHDVHYTGLHSSNDNDNRAQTHLSHDKYPKAVKSNSHYLFPNYGVLFEPVASLIATSEYYFLHLHILLPEYNTIYNQVTPEMLNDDNLLCMAYNAHNPVVPDHTGSDPGRLTTPMPNLARPLCRTYDRLLTLMSTDLARHKSNLKLQLDNIQTFVRQGRRHKRGLLAIGASLLSGAFRTASWYLNRKRQNAMLKIIRILQRRNDILTERYMDLSKDMITYTSVANTQIKHLDNQFHKLRNDLYSLHQITFHGFKVFNKSIQMLKNFGIENRNYITMNARAINVQFQLNNYIITTSDMFTKTLEGFYQLEKGQLPSLFVSRSQLSQALIHVEGTLQSSHPNHDLVFKNPRDIYLQNDVSYILDGHMLVIQIPLYVTRRTTAPMTLYQITTTEVPFITNDNQQDKEHPSFTKLESTFQYIATDQSTFIPLHFSDLQKCNKFMNFYVCVQQLIQFHRSSKNCLATIFWDRPIEEVLKVCEFKFYYNLHPIPQILSADEWILIAHIPTPWTLLCNTHTIPVTHKSDSYCIIHRSVFCKCVFQSLDLFIPADELNCNRTVSTSIQHPLNTVVAYKLQHLFPHFQQLDIQFDAKTVYTSDVDMPLPHFQLVQTTDNDVIEDANQLPPTDLDHVIDTISQKHETFLTNLAKEKANDNIDGLFEEQKGIGGLLFVGSLLGLLAFVVMIILCFYTGRMKLLFTTLLSQLPQGANATEILPHYCNNFFYHLVISTSYHILYGLLVILSYQLLKRLYYKIILFRYYIPVKGENQCHPGKTHLYLEIFSDSDKLLLYIGSIQTSILNFRLSKTVHVTNLSLTNRICFNFLKISWSENNYAFEPHIFSTAAGIRRSHSDPTPISTFSLPLHILINPLKYRKLKRILTNQYASRTLLLSDVFYPLTEFKFHAASESDYIIPHATVSQINVQDDNPSSVST